MHFNFDRYFTKKLLNNACLCPFLCALTKSKSSNSDLCSIDRCSVILMYTSLISLSTNEIQPFVFLENGLFTAEPFQDKKILGKT